MPRHKGRILLRCPAHQNGDKPSRCVDCCDLNGTTPSPRKSGTTGGQRGNPEKTPRPITVWGCHPIPLDISKAVLAGRPGALERAHAYMVAWLRLSAGESITALDLATLTRMAKSGAGVLIARVKLDIEIWRSAQPVPKVPSEAAFRTPRQRKASSAPSARSPQEGIFS